jgi:hypothetical protein
MKIVELKWGEIIAEDSADNGSQDTQESEEVDENGGEEE